MIGPSDHLQIMEATIEHEYEEDGVYERVKDSVPEENITDGREEVQLKFPLHRDTSVNPDDEEVFGYNVATCAFRPDMFFVYVPFAPRIEWLLSAHSNIAQLVEEQFDVNVPVDDDFAVYHEYGFPNPAIDLSLVRELVDYNEHTIESLDAEWFTEGNETYAYSLPKGTVYFDMDESIVNIDAATNDMAEEVREKFSLHLSDVMTGVIDSYPVEVEPEPLDIFRKEIIYPALVLNPDVIHVWNSVVDKLYSTDLVNDKTPIVRERLSQEVGYNGHQSLLAWLSIASAIEHEIPIVGQTESAIREIAGDDVYVNWFNSGPVMRRVGNRLVAYIEQNSHAYGRSMLQDEDGYFIVPAEKKGVKVGVKADKYEPVINLKDDWSETDRIDDYFWAEGVWWFRIIGAKPYDHRFSKKHAYEYLSEGEKFPATARDIEVAEKTTREEIESEMVLADEY